MKCPTCKQTGPCREGARIVAPHSAWIAIAVPETGATSRERHAQKQRELRAVRVATRRCVNHRDRIAVAGVRCFDCAAVHGGYAAVKDRVAALQRELRAIQRAPSLIGAAQAAV